MGGGREGGMEGGGEGRERGVAKSYGPEAFQKGSKCPACLISRD